MLQFNNTRGSKLEKIHVYVHIISHVHRHGRGSFVPRPHLCEGKGSGDFGHNAWSYLRPAEEFQRANQIQERVIIRIIFLIPVGYHMVESRRWRPRPSPSTI